MRYKKINDNMATINLLLIVAGFPFFTTLFLSPEYGGNVVFTRYITFPLRILFFIVSIYVLLSNVKKLKKANPYIHLLVFFAFLYLLKMFFLISILKDTVAAQYSINEYYLYAIGIVFMPMLSVIVSYDKIKIKVFEDVLYYALMFVVIIGILKNLDSGEDLLGVRQEANVALGAISYGQIAVSLIVLSVYRGFFQKKKEHVSYVEMISIFIGVYALLKAGSRGPLVSLIVTINMMLFIRNKNWAVIFLFISLMIYLLFDDFIEVINQVSPVIVNRINNTDYESEARTIIYNDAIRQFLSSPIIGDDFVMTRGIAKGWYPHNIILESLIAGGISGGLMMIITIVKGVYNSYHIMMRKESYTVYALLYVQTLFSYMFSGSIYAGANYFALLVCVLSWNKYKKNNV